MCIFSEMVNQVIKYSTMMLTESLPKEMAFHNYYHTKEVATAVIEIGKEAGLTSNEIETVLIAAWFHDTGYSIRYVNHENASQEIARIFLTINNYAMDKIEKVMGCIEATKYPQRPNNILEEVLCDADFYHLSSADYHTSEKTLREEWTVYLKKKYTDREWHQENYNFLISHSYFTTYAKDKLQKQKERNIDLLKSAL